MRGLNFPPTLAMLSSLSETPWRSLQTLVRTTEDRFRPARIESHRPAVRHAQARMLDEGQTPIEHRASVRCESSPGRVPTIVLGGFVPDATEQVFLLRRFLLKSGSVYYVSYPAGGFSLDLMCAQLSDLVAELAAAGTPPVLLGVSFGGGLILEWLRRERAAGREPATAGVSLISPVTCAHDLIAPGRAKPVTLVGRALKPFLDLSVSDTVAEAATEKARAIFLRMFEAGAQNKATLRSLMTATEAARLKDTVMATIRGITPEGARDRVQALRIMASPTDYFTPNLLPLTKAPALVLFAEREDAVLDPLAPVLFAFERAGGAYFPQGTVRRVTGRAGEAGVQHASLVFHVFEFLPPLQAFYQRVRRANLALAA